jgi:hypothetical protein
VADVAGDRRVTPHERRRRERDAAALAVEFERYTGDLSDWKRVRVGRPGLPGHEGEGPSPRVTVRLPAPAYRALRDRAARDHRRVSDLAREAIEAYLAPDERRA